MCGIIGYIGKENTVSHLIDGLRALEYRGYDSAGIAFFGDSGLTRIKASGRLGNLVEKLPENLTAHCGIGHTRWATHGVPNDRNAHPHGTSALQLVHNGIIENYAGLKQELTALGYIFESDTDTEVAAKLLDYCYRQEHNPMAAIAETTSKLRGSYAFGILFADIPDTIYAVRRDSPLILGLGGENGNFIASDITAILHSTRDYYMPDENEIAVVKKDSIRIFKDGHEVIKEKKTASWDREAAQHGGYPHFMAKEIHEEPEAIIRTLRPRISDGLPDFSNEKISLAKLVQSERIHIVACGTAMHAGLTARGLFNTFAQIPVEVETSSEFRYNRPILGKNDTVLIISQSGETADSLAALRLAKEKGAYTLAIVNVNGSSIAREAESVLYTLAGPEIAVASTKAYSVQTALLALIAVACGYEKKLLTEAETKALTANLTEEIPSRIAGVIGRADEIRAIADKIKSSEHLFYIGRGMDYYLSCEGSLKLKEISYIHSEAYAAGELKHGTISLIVPNIPVIAICTENALREKTVSNIREVKARGAYVIAIGKETVVEADLNFVLPPMKTDVAKDDYFAFLPAATVLQMLAYNTSVARGCDVDKPRNLAKSVTVE